MEDVNEEKLGEIMDSEDTWVLDFWASWCGPCKKLAPVYEKVSKEVSDVNFGKVNMEEHQELGGKMGVRALPTLLVIKNGQEVARQTGAMTEPQLKKWVEEKA